ncbi:DUF4440 domain-containing protein [Pseudoduganella umbonata]|uniref:DUF4440 domain-containing protein n=2 Tax=Pseudoduganella umbonata TaxID=864828 RepID=A0ABX5UEJ9_9BURK|nr:DUF4440 domain-containing protein [Pseudoduganella umbonata]
MHRVVTIRIPSIIPRNAMSLVRRSLAAIALTAPALMAHANPGLLAEVKTADAAYWKAYNDCDYAALDKLTAENVEFYHDQGGVTNGRAALTDSVRKNICGRRPAVAVTRSAQEKDVQIFLLNRGPDVYGALVTGKHAFAEGPVGSRVAPVGQALYSTLWLRGADKGWTISRVISYDHKPIPNDSQAIELSAAELDRFVGSYSSGMQKSLDVKRDGGNLSVEVEGRAVTLYPKGANTFFMKERQIEVEFNAGPDGKVSGHVVRANGQPVDQGKRL